MNSSFFKENKKPEVKQLHILLSHEDHQRLVSLTEQMEMNASDVLRTLIRSVRVKGT